MPRLRIVLSSMLVLVGVAALVLVIALTAFVRRPLPDYSDEAELAGLSGEVEVLRDSRGIPQIYADDAADLFRAQGYVHAQDRFFEMDLRRHITAGRLSELVGDSDDALQSDRVVRTLGWRRVAEAELPLLDQTTREYLQTYADGVNEYISDRSPSELSVAYTVLDSGVDLDRIEPWEPVDSLAWLKAMAWDLRSNYDDELGRALAYGSVGDEAKVAQLYPEYPYTQNAPILPSPGTAGVLGSALAGPQRADDAVAAVAGEHGPLAAVRDALAAVPELLGAGEGVGSNSWVVSGEHTATGQPLLANDPHLAPRMPSTWYQVGLHCREVGEACPFDVAGFSFSGMPGVVIGHNAHVAWGMTNMGADVTDFYLERVIGNTYLRDGAQLPVEVRTETIEVAGGPPQSVTIRSTVHGPILSDVTERVADAGRTTKVPANAPIQGSGYEVSLAWAALTPGRTMDALFGLNAAGDWNEFRAAASLFEVPAQNLVYADTEGNIGYQAPGRVPIRKPGTGTGQTDGTWPRAGWDSAWDWAGFVPFDDMPSVLNPEQGFVVAANQAVTAPGAGPFLTEDFDYGYRSQRIRDVIEGWISSGHEITAADMSGLQLDTRNDFAPTLVAALLATPLDDTTSVPDDGQQFTEEARALLADWDFDESADSAAAAYYNTVWSNLLHLTFGDEPGGAILTEGGSRWFEVVAGLLQDDQSSWWDDQRTPTVVEQRDQILAQSLYQARLELTASLGKDPSRWRWGRLHQLRLEQQPLGGDGVPGPVRWLFNPHAVGVGGGSSIVNATGWDASIPQSYKVNWAPSMRMVVDLSDLDSSTWLDLTGISGHPWSPHYGDQLDAWADGETYPWPFSRPAVEEAEEDTLRLTPAPEPAADP